MTTIRTMIFFHRQGENPMIKEKDPAESSLHRQSSLLPKLLYGCLGISTLFLDISSWGPTHSGRPVS